MPAVDLERESTAARTTSGRDRGRPSWTPRTRFRFATGLLAAASAAAAVIGSAAVFPLLSQNSDEGAYLSQASALRAGDLIPRAPAVIPELFQPWFSVLREGNFVFKYAPVHAALLAAVPDALGGPRVALGLLAAVAVVLVVALARELGAGRRGAWAAGAVFACSPVVVVQSATYLPYLSSLVLLLGFAFAARRGARTARSGPLLAGGILLGLAFWARPYDALLFATPMITWQALRCHRRADSSTVRHLLGWLAVGAVPGLVCFLVYNALATGSPVRLPFRLQEQADNLGFGERRTNQLEPFFEYTAAAAWRATRENARLLLTWSFGSVMLVVLGTYGTFVRPLARSRWLLTTWLVVWPVGFFFFWGSFSYIFRWDGGRYLGPYYYLPMLVPLAIGAGMGLERAVTRGRWTVAVFAVAASALAIPVIADTVIDNLARTEHRRAVAQSIDRVVDRPRGSDRRAVVLIPGVWGPHLQHPFSFLRNDPGYDGDRVYALETGTLDLAVADRYPDRDVFVVSLPEGYRDGTSTIDSPIWVERQDVVRGTSVDVGIDGIRSAVALALRIDIAGRRLDVPLDASGSAHVTLTALTDGIAIRNPADESAQVVAEAPEQPVRVSLVRRLANGGAQTLEQRLVPLARTRDGLAVMWPGTVDASLLRPSDQSSWSARATSP